jgi:tRNA(adenine34) deaminase
MEVSRVPPHQLLGLAIDVAEEGLAAGELPIGAFVATGDEVVDRAYTQERALNRRRCMPSCRP